MPTPLVSIVVLNWNGQRFIDLFMKSFERLDYPPDRLELIFADNGSTDDSVDYLKTHYGQDQRLKIVLNGRNYGYSQGNNLGLKQARGDYLLISNNDLEWAPDLLTQLVATAKTTKAAVVAPKLLYRNQPGVINNAGSRLVPTSSWPIIEEGIDQKDTGQFDEDREITAFCGACALVRRDFLQTVGLFDKRFFMYFEDGDLSWRGQKAGYKYWYAPKAVAYHVHTGTSKVGSPLFNHFVGRNRILILTKNAGFYVLAKGWYKTLHDHLWFRLKNLWASLRGRYNKRMALREFWLSQKLIWAAAVMTPYALAKRYKLIREDKL